MTVPTIYSGSSLNTPASLLDPPRSLHLSDSSSSYGNPGPSSEVIELVGKINRMFRAPSTSDALLGKGSRSSPSFEVALKDAFCKQSVRELGRKDPPLEQLIGQHEGPIIFVRRNGEVLAAFEQRHGNWQGYDGPDLRAPSMYDTPSHYFDRAKDQSSFAGYTIGANAAEDTKELPGRDRVTQHNVHRDPMIVRLDDAALPSRHRLRGDATRSHDAGQPTYWNDDTGEPREASYQRRIRAHDIPHSQPDVDVHRRDPLVVVVGEDPPRTRRRDHE